jgi:serine palmitoyltransferase
MAQPNTNIPTLTVEQVHPSTAGTPTASRQRAFSFSNFVLRTRRAYSLSSVNKPEIPHDPIEKLKLPSLTPAQRRNSIAAAQRKYEDFEQKIEEAPLFVLVSTYLNYFVLILFGHLRDITGKIFKRKRYAHLRMNEVRIRSIAINQTVLFHIYFFLLLKKGICTTCV